jgi:hypothetical protein
MTPNKSADEEPLEVHEGAWVYVSGPLHVPERQKAVELYEQLAAACESSGWHAYRPYRDILGPGVNDPEPLFDRVRHAVEHADACILYIGAPSSSVGAELALAYEHNRPIIGVYLRDEQPSELVSSMLATYPRARLVRCSDAGECADHVKQVLSDPEFSGFVRAAAAEGLEHV